MDFHSVSLVELLVPVDDIVYNSLLYLVAVSHASYRLIKRVTPLEITPKSNCKSQIITIPACECVCNTL